MQSFIPVLILVSVGNASKSPQVQGFLNAINQSRESHKGLYGDERIEAFQKDFFQISLDYPIVTDWVMQDGGSDAWVKSGSTATGVKVSRRHILMRWPRGGCFFIMLIPCPSVRLLGWLS